MRTAQHWRRSLNLVLESLESRQVLSGVAVMPHEIALASVNHGKGVATVAVLGDSTLNVSTIDSASLTVTATPTGGGASVTLQLKGSAKVETVSGTMSPDLILHFTRSQLQGLTGKVTIDVQGTTTVGGVTSGVTDFGSDILTIFKPGSQHAHGASGGHHAHGPTGGSHTHGPTGGLHTHGPTGGPHTHGPAVLIPEAQAFGTLSHHGKP